MIHSVWEPSDAVVRLALLGIHEHNTTHSLLLHAPIDPVAEFIDLHYFCCQVSLQVGVGSRIALFLCKTPAGTVFCSTILMCRHSAGAHWTGRRHYTSSLPRTRLHMSAYATPRQTPQLPAQPKENQQVFGGSTKTPMWLPKGPQYGHALQTSNQASSRTTI